MELYIKLKLETLITILKALSDYYIRLNQPATNTEGQLEAIDRILALIDIFDEKFIEHLPKLKDKLPYPLPQSSTERQINEKYLEILDMFKNTTQKIKPESHSP